MRYLSLFSGIEAASQAWMPLGWKCVGVAEILPYQSSVIKHHFPEVKNFGDVTKITDEDIKSLGKIDVVIFGSPCQDMSIAGKRQGLDTIKDDSNHSSILFYEGVRVFRLAQKYCGARYMLWENVPGALSSQEGRDFGKVLTEMVGVEFGNGGFVWGNEGVCFGRNSMCEWSVLDAQWFGVAQRRRRLFVILDTGNWKNRKPILLEQECLRGNSPPSREKGKTITNEIEGSVNKSINTFDRQRSGEYGINEVASTIAGRNFKSSTDLIVEKDYCCAIVSNIIGRNPETRSGGNGTGFNEDVMYTITGADHHAIAYGISGNNDTGHYLRAGASKADKTDSSTYVVQNTHVRRLTPIECERLQGFPDGWTDVNNASFGKRINALGRSMAVPVIKWIGEQIERA